MNCTLSKIAIFATGAAIGSVVTWRVLKTKYEQIAKEEIASVKEVFANRCDFCTKKVEPEAEDTEEVTRVEEEKTERVFSSLSEKPSIMDYAKMVHKQGYDDGSKKEVDKKVDRPYVISPDDFGDIYDYDIITLTYYDDGVLTDDMDEVIEDVDDIVGVDSLNHFGEYEDDCVFVRNDRLKADYEILYDVRNYADVIKDSPHRAEDE